MTETSTQPRPKPPAPRSVSAEAYAYLDMPSPYGPMVAPDDPADVDGWIRYIEASNAILAKAFGARGEPSMPMEERVIGGVSTYVARPTAATDATPIYLDIHGGALILGGGEVCRLMAGLGAEARGMITWAVDYRMPPQHRYPAALDDCLAAYRAALDERAPEDVFVGGGSAGGNLAAALLVRAKDEGLPMPAGLVLLSPEVDLTESGDSFTTNLGVDHVLRPLMSTNLLYADGHDLAHPYLSPLFGDLAGFPPTFLQTGTRDLFLSNTVRMHRRLRQAGVRAELHVFEAMPHGGFGGGTPEDREIQVEVRRFLDALRRDQAPSPSSET